MDALHARIMIFRSYSISLPISFVEPNLIQLEVIRQVWSTSGSSLLRNHLCWRRSFSYLRHTILESGLAVTNTRIIMQASNCSTRSSSYTVHFYTFAITGWLPIRSNDSSSSRIPFASHETYIWSMCPASTSTLLLPVPLGIISRHRLAVRRWLAEKRIA